MGKVNALTHLFNAGQISRAALNRVDKEIIRLHAEEQTNLLPYTIGKARMRPGLKRLGDSLNGARPRLLPFAKGLDDVAMIEAVAGGMRVWVDDAPVMRPAVTTTITNGDFSSATGWTETETGAATATIADGVLTLSAPARGGRALVRQQIDINEIGTEHAVRVSVTNGPVTLRIGATEGGDEYLQETTLGSGIHSLAFTPTGLSAVDELTMLLLHFDGSNGSTVITDSSQYGHTATFVGNGAISTTTSKFGGASAGLDGVGGDSINLDGSSDFAFGDGDFTIDFWFYRTALTVEDHHLYDGKPFGQQGVYPTIYLTDGGTAIRYYVDSADRISVAAPALATWHHCAVTRAGSTTRLFVNGVVQGSFNDTFTYLNPSSNRPVIGRDGSGDGTVGELFGFIDELRVSKGIARWTANFTPPASAYNNASNSAYIELSSIQERNVIVDSIQIESEGVMSLEAPWGEDDLREIRIDQSGDVIFMANANWQPRQIERRSATSWSLARYSADDGPFTLGRTAVARLKANETHGNVTLTSDVPFFRPEHVGALFRLDHERFAAEFVLAAEGTNTDAWRLRGIGTENDFGYDITGTFSATYSLQRSFDGPDTGFADVSTGSIPASGTLTNDASYDNQIFWMRYAIKDGDFVSGSIAFIIEYGGFGGGGVVRITEYGSPTSVEAEILDDLHDTTYTRSWLEGDWSDRRGWPEAVGFFDGRLWWGRRDKFWGSESDNYYAFNLDTEGDSGSIQRAIASGGFTNQIQWIMGLQRLMLGTNAAPMSCRSSSFDEPLTPTNLTMKPADDTGAARISPLVIGSRGVYVGSDGRRVFELAFSVDAQDYVASDLTRLVEDLADARNPDLYQDAYVELGYQSSPEPYVWAVRDDGVLAAALFNPSEEARGWFTVSTGEMDILDSTRPTDRVVSIVVLPRTVEDSVYVAVERTISDGAGGTTQAYGIEKFARHQSTLTRVYNPETRQVDVKNGLCLVDSYIEAVAGGALGQVFTGLDHLEGRDVMLVGQQVNGGYGPGVDEDGNIAYHTVEDGQITATVAMEGDICIGLPYEGRYKSAKLAFAAQGGTALLQQKHVERLGLALLDTHPDALRVGPEFDDDSEMDELPRTLGDGTQIPFATTTFLRASEDEPFPFPGEWSTDARVCIKVRPGFSATLSALVTGVETKEA